MVKPPSRATEVFLELRELIRRLEERLELLELQNLHERLEQAVELAERRAEEHDHQLLRLAEVVADLSTR